MRRTCFSMTGRRKPSSGRVHPIEGQNAAQAISTLAAGGESRPDRLEQAWRVYAYAIARLSRSDGAFAFQRHRLWLDRTPHVRWVQAPMLDALSRLLRASGGRATRADEIEGAPGGQGRRR